MAAAPRPPPRRPQPDNGPAAPMLNRGKVHEACAVGLAGKQRLGGPGVPVRKDALSLFPFCALGSCALGKPRSKSRA
jgi:hypothetical protein